MGGVHNFLAQVVALPCWVDHQLSGAVFGAKQNLDFWELVFETGQAPSQIQVLAEGLNLIEMIKPPVAGRPDLELSQPTRISAKRRARRHRG